MGLGVKDFWVEGLGLRVCRWSFSASVFRGLGFQALQDCCRGALRKKHNIAFFAPLFRSALLHGNKNLRNPVLSFHSQSTSPGPNPRVVMLRVEQAS